ncbi:ribonuclease H-like domain-containing protein [Tanacetum coccineum]
MYELLILCIEQSEVKLGVFFLKCFFVELSFKFIRDTCSTVEFDAFGFSVKDFLTRRVLLRCDSTGDFYPVTKPSNIPHAFLTSQYMWHQRLGHPGSEVLRCVLSSNSISCNKEKLPILCHACQLGKHVKLPFVRSNTLVHSCLDIIKFSPITHPTTNTPNVPTVVDSSIVTSPHFKPTHTTEPVPTPTTISGPTHTHVTSPIVISQAGPALERVNDPTTSGPSNIVNTTSPVIVPATPPPTFVFVS